MTTITTVGIARYIQRNRLKNGVRHQLTAETATTATTATTAIDVETVETVETVATVATVATATTAIDATSQTTIYFSKDKTDVVCGCFKGTLEEFEVKVNSEYSEESKHGIEYRDFIKKAKVYMESK